MRKKYKSKLLIALVLLLTLLLNITVPFFANAQTVQKKVVRVGWHEPPFFIKDDSGRRSGYSYEYLRKLSAYTNWEYEYVEGSWSDLMQMLREGKIDMMSNVSYTEERTKDMLYTSIPMGTEAYYVFVSPNNTEITSDNISSLKGKKVGVAKDSIQKDLFKNWTKKRNIDVNIMELSATGDELLDMLGKDLDAVVTMDVYGTHEVCLPVCKIGSSDFYFVVSKNRQDLLDVADSALNRIQDENKYYDQQLYDKYLKNTENSRYLSFAEKEWLTDHGKIRIGYQDNYMAYCKKDESTGKLTGALKDYLDYASNAFENANIEFEPVCFPTSASALKALKNGEIDCLFPSNMSDYDAETNGLMLTPAIMHSEMDAVVRESGKKEFLEKKKVIVGVNEGNTNYDIFLAKHYPDWERKYFKDTPAALDAVAKKEADCVIISTYRYSNISKQCERLHLTTVNTGVEMDYFISVCEGNTELYSILSRVTDVTPKSIIHKALTYYSTEDVKTSFIDLIKENIFVIITSVTLVLLLIMLLIIHSIRAEKKVVQEKHMIKDLNKKVFVDALTSVRNKGAFSDYIDKMQTSLNEGEEFEFAIGIFDCNNLKTVNDRHGHDKGDIYLKTACRLICKIFDHSPVFRIGGDEFAVILRNGDFNNREELLRRFEERKKELSKAAENKWEEVDIASGIAVYDPEEDTAVIDTMRRADRLMYENKKSMKAQIR